MGCTIDYCYVCVDVPKCYEEAITHEHSNEWKRAMDDEMFALGENNTYELVPLPPDRKAIQGRWVYAEKLMPCSSAKQFKARFVAKGCSQKADIDYHEIFSPTANMTSIRTLMQLAVDKKMGVHQMDVKSAYLNAPIDVEIYVQQPQGYEIKDKDGNPLVWKLNKSLYGLKQSGRNWNNMLHDYLINQGFTQSLTDTCVYTKQNAELCIVLIWVDDIIIASTSDSCLKVVKEALKCKFKMKDLGKISHFLGIEFLVDNDTISMSQGKYIERLLEKFQMHNCKPKLTPCDPNINKICSEPAEPTDATLYREIVGSLIYAMTATRPDLCYVVTKLSQYMSNPNKNHMSMAKHVLRYLRGTTDQKLVFRIIETGEVNLYGFCDSDWANGGDRRSITGYGFELTPNGPLISWKSKKQQTVALSTCEAEYMSLASAAQEGKFLKSLITDMMGTEVNNFYFTVTIKDLWHLPKTQSSIKDPNT